MENLNDISESEYKLICSQIAAIATGWKSYSNLVFTCEFDGKLHDVLALDYIFYASLSGFPEDDYQSLAMAWGNVLVAHLGFQWTMVGGRRGNKEVGLKRSQLVILPWPRVFEALTNGKTQRGIFEKLLFNVMDEIRGVPHLRPTLPPFTEVLGMTATAQQPLPAEVVDKLNRLDKLLHALTVGPHPA